jgi:hypothetical protein
MLPTVIAMYFKPTILETLIQVYALSATVEPRFLVISRHRSREKSQGFV